MQDINYHSFRSLKASLFFFSNGNYLNRVYNFGLYDFFLFSFHYFQITTPVVVLHVFWREEYYNCFVFVYFMILIPLRIFSLCPFIYSLWYYLDAFFISVFIFSKYLGSSFVFFLLFFFSHYLIFEHSHPWSF